MITAQKLALAPYQGTLHDELRPGLRITGFGRAVAIVFNVYDDAFESPPSVTADAATRQKSK